MATKSGMSSKPQVCIARSESERADIYRFRYRLFVEEMHRDHSAADAKREMMRDPMDDTGLHLYMVVDGKVVATIRLNLGKLTTFSDVVRGAYALDKFVAFPSEQISTTTQLMVSERWRSSSVPAVLLGATYKLARQQGVRFDFCQCPPYLVPLYERLGYRRYTDNFVDPDTGYAVPMVLLTEDLDYLRACKSPFFRIASQFPNNRKAVEWFHKEFREVAIGAPRSSLSEEDFWQLLTQKLHQIPLVSIPLLKGLSYEDAKSFLNRGSVMHAKCGDVIMRAGDSGNEMFVVLNGAVELRSIADDGTEHLLNRLDQGEIFGELGLLATTPRSANVVAVADSEVLILTQNFFEQVMNSMPEITVKVLFNLCLILCERLKASSDNWIAAMMSDAARTAASQPHGPTPTSAKQTEKVAAKAVS